MPRKRKTAPPRGVPVTWVCHARPARLGGQTCHHVNVEGATRFNGLEVCAGCGCTRKASEDRRRA